MVVDSTISSFRNNSSEDLSKKGELDDVSRISSQLPTKYITEYKTDTFDQHSAQVLYD